MMKRRPVLSALLFSSTFLPAQEPGTAPACWFENVHAADDSIQRNKVLLDTEGNNLLVHVLEHEIGHVMIGAGHADTGNCPATLFWKETNPTPLMRSGDPRDRARLMCSGEGADPDNHGKQLIYKEWTLIEAWLKHEEDEHRLPW
jgi:hypothetical protein